MPTRPRSPRTIAGVTRLALLATLSLVATILGGCESAATSVRPGTASPTSRSAASTESSIPNPTLGAGAPGASITAAALRDRLDALAGLSATEGFRSVGIA